MKKIIISVLLFGSLAACSSGSKSTDASQRNSKEYTSNYICPMHCEGSGSDSTGNCPKCGMDYVENESKKK